MVIAIASTDGKSRYRGSNRAKAIVAGVLNDVAPVYGSRPRIGPRTNYGSSIAKLELEHELVRMKAREGQAAQE